MGNFHVEKVWESNGLKCVVVVNERVGHRCGYVGVPSTHPLYCVNYSTHSDVLAELYEKASHQAPDSDGFGIIPWMCSDGTRFTPELSLQVHGGLTYSGGEKDYPIDNEELLWWFGYDCGHCNDGIIPEYNPHGIPSYGEVRTLEYCIAECESLAKQLVSLQKIKKECNHESV